VRGSTKLNRKQEAVIAALLTEPTHAAAAATAGVSEATLHRWLLLPEFQAAYRKARRAAVESAIGRLQQRAGKAVETLENRPFHGDQVVRSRFTSEEAASIVNSLSRIIPQGK